MDADTVACAALTEKADPDRFAATMALPLDARMRLFPLWAFNVEVARAPWVTQEPLIAQMRLQWWIDALDEIAARAVVRRHEVVTPLATLLSPAQAGTLKPLIEARRRDIESDMFADRAALDAYLANTTGTLLWVAAQLLGAAASEEADVRRVGRPIAMANFMRALPELEARGKRPMPDGRAETLAELARSAIQDFTAQNRVSKASRQVLLTGFQARATLRLVARAPALVAQNRLHRAPVSRSLLLLKAHLTGRI